VLSIVQTDADDLPGMGHDGCSVGAMEIVRLNAGIAQPRVVRVAEQRSHVWYSREFDADSVFGDAHGDRAGGRP